ncbi:MAG: insulinase family protein [Spirochaetia bacterium]|nr:insulinase family protein [Spirochaetia bacterium]
MDELAIGDTLHGFTLISKTDLPEQHGTGLRFRHDATGLDLFQVANDDPENLFSFIFKTPPRNNAGTPHIIEHSVLAGSKKYPVKDPFLSLMKGSAHTFLNAMTYPDKTVYPVASPLKKDYYHMLSVYADAVFFPLLRKETFKQEGIRITVDPKGALSYDGIVFNEMKGAYSDHDSIVSEHSVRSLFPDTAYGFDSGGDPKEIPKLTYDGFKGFHAEFYHPSNCRVFLYGDIPIEEQLQFLQSQYLKDFTAIKFCHEVNDPKPWDKPVYQEFTTPLNDGESTQAKSTITMNWAACSILDPLDVMTLEVLTEALLGNPGAPLYKAIIDSGLGTDISSISGMDSDFKQVVFSLGIRGTDPDKREVFEQLMRGELSSLVKQGISAELVFQAIKRIEFQQREIRGGIPTGLRVMSRAARGWLHGMTPEATLVFTPVMERLKAVIAADESPKGYLSQWIRTHLLENRHCSVVVVRPDAAHSAAVEDELAAQLAAIQKKMTKKELKLLADEQQRFLDFQRRPDAAEDVARIPRLTREDLPPEISTIDVERTAVDSVPCYQQRLFTNGIVYLDMAFDLSDLPAAAYDYLPLFSRLLYMTGIPGFSYDRLSRLLAEKTGSFHITLDVGTPEVQRHLIVRTKMLKEDVREAVDLIRKVLLTSELWDLKRIRDIIREQRSDFSTSVIPSGSSYAMLRASSRICPASLQEDRWKGLGQWHVLNMIDDEDEKALLELAKTFDELRDTILVKNRLTLNVSCDESVLEEVKEDLRLFTDELPAGYEAASEAGVSFDLPPVSSGEVFLVPSQVAYTALVCKSDVFGSPEQTAQSILAHMLSTKQLWDAIRVLGGAYGASASVDVIEGLFMFSSYRDPRIADTYIDFQQALQAVSSGELDSESVELSVISLVGKDMRPMSPGEKSYIGFKRELYGITDEIRRKRRAQLLAAGRDDIIEAARLLHEYMTQRQSLAVLCSQDMYMKDKKRLPACLNEVSVLPL